MITFFIISALVLASATTIQKGESLHEGGCLEYSKETGVERGNLNRTFSNFGPDFTITFDMRITEVPVDFHNILHLTYGRDCCEAGTRIPGVWLNSSNGKPYLHAAIAMTRYFTTQNFALEMNKQYFIELVQAEGFFTVKINHEQVWQLNSGSATFQNVNYYLSDPWYPSAGEVAVLSIPKIWQG